MNKRLCLLIVAFFTTAVLSAQVPLTFTYQAVVRDAQGRLVCNNNVGVRLSILQGSVDGIVVYSDRQTAHTNANGLFTVLIGSDENSLAHIDWAAGPYFLKSEVDPAGGTTYTLTTVQQMFSVPYAIRAHLADSVSNETDPVFMSWPKDYNDLINSPTNVSAFTNDAGYLTTETDPIFSAWDKDYDDLTNKPTNVSTFTNDVGYLTTETDPIFSAWDKDYDDLINKPTNVSTFTNDAGYITISSVPTNISAFVNDAGYLTSYTETDPQFSAWPKDYNDLTNRPNLSDSIQSRIDTLSFLRSYIETDPQFNAWTKDYNDLTNKPTIPTVPSNVSAFTNDAGYLTSYSETQTLADVVALGNTANAQIKGVSNPTDEMDAVNKKTMDSLIFQMMNHYDSILARQQATIDSQRNMLLELLATTGDTVAIACDSFVWHGILYTATPMVEPTHVYRSVLGADSVVTLHLNINNSSMGDTTIVSLGSFVWYGVTYIETPIIAPTHVLTNSAGCDSVVSLHLTVIPVGGFDTNGASRKTFSVAANRTVRFSKGNLQFNAAHGTHSNINGGTSQGTWRFAEHQYDYIGTGNQNISSSYNGWIDLFGWGTSGWNSGAVAYQPWSTSENDTHYLFDSLTGNYRKADWGVFNAISNGGNIPGLWHTMTREEWYYLLRSRSASTVNGTENARYAYAIIGEIYGMIIFPDVYSHPEGVELPININHQTSTSGPVYHNEYTITDWAALEAAGCVFLPVTMWRSGVPVTTCLLPCGKYWTSSFASIDDGHASLGVIEAGAYSVAFNGRGRPIEEGAVAFLRWGLAVRLVQDCE